MTESDGPLVLGIETSCDETGVGVVRGTTRLLSNVVASQEDLHSEYGGVVPEIAARAHLERLNATAEKALAEAGVSLEEVDAVAVTAGPGLAGALVVGVAAAKALALAASKPVVAVNHLEGHIFAALLDYPEFTPPAVALIVSGGHTMLVHFEELGCYRLLGDTLDDAVGEAFDKVARLLGFGFPGGPEIDRAAGRGHASALDLPRPMRGEGFDFSMAGLKTAVVNALRNLHSSGERVRRDDVAASFQRAVVDVLVEKTVAAADSTGVPSVVVCGGVAANSELRQEMKRACEESGLQLYIPQPRLCVDNGAMIASAGAFRFEREGPDLLDFEANPSLLAPFDSDDLSAGPSGLGPAAASGALGGSALTGEGGSH